MKMMIKPQNCKKTGVKRYRERGNAMIYILIALALFGFLTLTLSKQNDQADGQDTSDEQIALYTNELLNYTAAAQNTVDMMLASGSEVSDLNFVTPSEAAFNTGSHIHKVFHPQGGGLNYQRKLNDDVSTTGANSNWYLMTTENVEWTPTASNDVILSALRIKKEVCENINYMITGTTMAPPAITVAFVSIFEPGGGTPLDSTSCPDCEGYPALCVINQSGNQYGFYSIIAAQ